MLPGLCTGSTFVGVASVLWTLWGKYVTTRGQGGQLVSQRGTRLRDVVDKEQGTK